MELLAALLMAITLVTGGFVQATHDNDDAVTTGFNSSGADLLVIAISAYEPGVDGTFVVEDSKTNTWTPLTQQVDGVNRSQLYYCVPGVKVGASHTFTVRNPLTAIYPWIGVAAFQGAHSSPYNSDVTGAHAASGTTVQPGSITPPEGNCVLVTSLTYGTGTGAPLTLSGFTVLSTDIIGGTAYSGAIAYQIQTTATAINPTWSWTGSSANAVTMASFKSAAGGGSSTVVPVFMNQYRQRRA